MMKEKKKLLIISYSKLDSDPRILRQIQYLGKNFYIHTAGFEASNHEFVSNHYNIKSDYTVQFHLNFPKLFRKFFTFFFVKPQSWLNSRKLDVFYSQENETDKSYWNIDRLITLNLLNKNVYDLVIANDIDTLPLAIKIKKQTGCKVYFDAHEYAPLEYENDANWLKEVAPIKRALCERYIPHSDYCTTVSNNLATKYQELTGVLFDIVYNAPSYQNLPIKFHDNNIIKCVHHGVASPIREVEKLIEAIKKLGNTFQLNLLLVRNTPEEEQYYQNLRRFAEDNPNIVFLEPVKTEIISEFISNFDVSLIFIPPVNFNYKYCLPNKFFESVQARLMLVCGPSPEMGHLVKQYDLGIISSGFQVEDIYNSLLNLDKKKILKYKQNANNSANELSAEMSMLKLEQNINKLFV